MVASIWATITGCELSLRHRVYPSLIQRGKLSAGAADHEKAAMAAIVAHFEGLVNVPNAMADVLAERGAQDAKWGVQEHDPFTYLTVLMEEVGELSQEALRSRFGNFGKSTDGTGYRTDGMRVEAIQVAAVALAIVECIDRGRWRWPVAAS